MDKKEREKIENWKRARATCDVCGEHFIKIANVGAWKCMQHADEFPGKGGVWGCCGAERRYSPHRFSKGCVRADHNSRPHEPRSLPSPYTHRQDEPLSPAAIAALVDVQPRAEIRETGGGYFYTTTVRRFEDPNLDLYD